MGAINDTIVDMVAKVLDQGAADNLEGVTFVVREQVLDVFQ